MYEYQIIKSNRNLGLKVKALPMLNYQEIYTIYYWVNTNTNTNARDWELKAF